MLREVYHGLATNETSEHGKVLGNRTHRGISNPISDGQPGFGQPDRCDNLALARRSAERRGPIKINVAAVGVQNHRDGMDLRFEETQVTAQWQDGLAQPAAHQMDPHTRCTKVSDRPGGSGCNRVPVCLSQRGEFLGTGPDPIQPRGIDAFQWDLACHRPGREFGKLRSHRVVPVRSQPVHAFEPAQRRIDIEND